MAVLGCSRGPSPEETELLQEIERLHGEGRVQEGLDKVRAHLEEHPNAPLFHYALGSLLGTHDDLQGAIAAFETELDRRPNHFGSLLGLATSHTLQGDLEAAVPLLERCRELDPEHPGTAYQLGKNLSDLGRLEDAEPHLVAAAELEDQAKHFAELGKLHQRQGNDEAAEAAFRRAVAKDPLYPAAMYNLGQTLLRLGREDEGRELMAQHEEQAADYDRFDAAKQSSKVEGSTAGNFLMLAREHLARGDLDAAADAYHRAGELDPTLPAPALGLAGIHLEKRDLAEATRWAVLGIALDPQRSRSHFVLGIIRLHRGETDAARVDFDTSLNLDAWTPDMYLHLGETHRELGNVIDAEESYLQALAVEPTLAAAHTGLGLLHYGQGQMDAATESLEAALELDPKQAQAWMTLGIVRFANGDRDTAAEAFRSAITSQRVVFFSDDGHRDMLARFSSLPNSADALELYGDIRDRAVRLGSEEEEPFEVLWQDGQ